MITVQCRLTDLMEFVRYYFSRVSFQGVNLVLSRNVKTSLKINANFFSTETELLDIFDQTGPPKYDKVFTPEPKKIETVNASKLNKKQEKVVIKCKRTEFNHYKNQKYDKLKPIPLVSKGWKHRKSKGDFFTIKIYDENYEPNLLYWDDEKSFSDLKIQDNVIEALQTQGITKPTKVQGNWREIPKVGSRQVRALHSFARLFQRSLEVKKVDSIPKLLSGKNCLIAAETGCGKTLAYLLPMVEQLMEWNKAMGSRPPNTPLALVLCPHRELALQIGDVAKIMSCCLPFTCTTLIGGRTKKKMLNPEFDYVDLLVATPGALSKLISTGIFNVNEVKHVVIDEADTMLDDSFNELLLRILSKLKIGYQNPSIGESAYPENCQLTLVSATMPKTIYKSLEGIVDSDSLMVIKTSRLHRILPHVAQTFYRLAVSEKPIKLLQMAKQSLKKKQPTLIFSNKSSTADWISLMLNENGVPAVNLNGEMNYAIRLGKYKEFRDGRVMVLSCTDVASRGLDTTHVKHILNYDFPIYMADYIHRCGRTGRCGSPSENLITNFITRLNEVDLLNSIEMAVRTQGDLPRVDGNISKLISRKYEQSS